MLTPDTALGILQQGRFNELKMYDTSGWRGPHRSAIPFEVTDAHIEQLKQFYKGAIIYLTHYGDWETLQNGFHFGPGKIDQLKYERILHTDLLIQKPISYLHHLGLSVLDQEIARERSSLILKGQWQKLDFARHRLKSSDLDVRRAHITETQLYAFQLGYHVQEWVMKEEQQREAYGLTQKDNKALIAVNNKLLGAMQRAQANKNDPLRDRAFQILKELNLLSIQHLIGYTG